MLRSQSTDRRLTDPSIIDHRIRIGLHQSRPIGDMVLDGARILTHIGEPSRLPPIAPARGPSAWEDTPEPMPDWDLLGQPEPDFAFD